MQTIVFTTSPDSTTLTPQRIGATIKKIEHEFPTNLPMSLKWFSFILSEHIHQGPINNAYLVSPRSIFLETNGLED